MTGATKPTEAQIQAEIDRALAAEGLCICRAVAVDRAREAPRKPRTLAGGRKQR
jgi:hypothetical protein